MLKIAAITIAVIAVLILCAVVGGVVWMFSTLDEVDLFDPCK